MQANNRIVLPLPSPPPIHPSPVLPQNFSHPPPPPAQPVVMRNNHGPRAPPTTPATPLFNRRSPLLPHAQSSPQPLGGSDGFILTPRQYPPTSLPPNHNVSLLPSRQHGPQLPHPPPPPIDQDQDRHFRRRFGDVISQHSPSSPSPSPPPLPPPPPTLPTREELNSLLHDISAHMNELELNGELPGLPPLPLPFPIARHQPSQQMLPRRAASFLGGKPLRKMSRSLGDNNFGDYSAPSQQQQPSPTSSVPPPHSLPPQQLAQMMPLFFDKFLANLANMPPSQSQQPGSDGFRLDNGRNDLSAHGENSGGVVDDDDEDGPDPHHQRSKMARHFKVPKSGGTGEEIYSPNELGDDQFLGDGPPPPSSSTSGPSTQSPGGSMYPQIFRFTDGRANLYEFEREKKRSRIKFSQKLAKGANQALYNIKRESFLILHGGTLNH